MLFLTNQNLIVIIKSRLFKFCRHLPIFGRKGKIITYLIYMYYILKVTLPPGKIRGKFSMETYFFKTFPKYYFFRTDYFFKTGSFRFFLRSYFFPVFFGNIFAIIYLSNFFKTKESLIFFYFSLNTFFLRDNGKPIGSQIFKIF
jgi:hypothetical protein